MQPSPPLRLAYLADPNSTHTRRWITYFARRGHEVHLLDGLHTVVAQGLDSAIEVHRYEASPPRITGVSLLRARASLRQVLRRLEPDVLHALFVRRYGWQAAISGFHPLVVSPWGSDLLRVAPRAVRVRFWNWFALRSANLVTVSSDAMRSVSVRAGAPEERIEFVSHGVDTRRFAPGPPEPRVRERLGANESPIVASLRAIRPLYRHEVVVEALGELAARPLLLMSARGADRDYLNRLHTRAGELGIADRMRILDDVSHDELPDLLRLADVVVSVPETDSFPLTILEAMACGRPVVASDLPAVTPVVTQLDPVMRELVVPVGDPRATAAAVRRALELAPGERDRLGTALREYVVHNADYETSMAQMEHLYRELVRR